MRKIKHFLQHSPGFWAAIAPFSFFIIPLLNGEAIFWGLPSTQFIPWRHYAWTLLRDGVVPLWNPLNGMGAPLLANYQLALFYPPAFPLFILDEIFGVGGLAWGFTLLVPAHLAWGGVGMTRFLRQLGVGSRGQLIAGLAFGMGGYLVARGSFFSILWAAAWLPWIICWVDKVITSKGLWETMRPGLTLSLLIAMMLLAGHAQISWYSLLLAAFWFLFRAYKLGRWSRLFQQGWKLAAIGLAAVLMAGIQLFPTFEYLQQSQRAAAYDLESAMVYSFSPLRLLGYLTPELFGNPGRGDFWGYATYWEDAVYIGLAPFILALSTTGWFLWKKHRENPLRGPTLFFWGITAAGILFALGSNTPVFPWFYEHVPTFDMFQAPARWMIWPTFALAVLAGLATDHWVMPSKKGKVILNLAAFGGLILALAASAASLVLTTWEPGVFRGLIFFGFSLAAAAFVARRIPTNKPAGIWGAAAVVVIVLDLISASYLLNPTAPASLWADENIQLAEIDQARNGGRIWMDPAVEQMVKYTWFFQFDDFTNREDWEQIRSSQLSNINLLDGTRMINNFDPLLPARYVTWKEHLTDAAPDVQRDWLRRVGAGAELIADPSATMRLKALPLAGQPRIAWTSCVVPAESPDEALDLVENQIRQGNSDCLVVENMRIPEGQTGEAVTAEIRLIADDHNKIEVIVDSLSAGWLLVRDTWFPGWRATIDGKDIALHPADYLFKSLPVPAGKHYIELEYKPLSFYTGRIVSLIFWILWGAAWSLSYRQREHPTKDRESASHKE